MSKSAVRDALLERGQEASVETDLTMLNALLQSEEIRAQRLTNWTLAAWGSWLVFLTLAFFVVYASHGVGPQAAPALPQGGFVSAMIVMTTCILGIGILFLPIVGIVLLIMCVFARRTASLSQLRASVASIDLQVKLLESAYKSRNVEPTSPK